MQNVVLVLTCYNRPNELRYCLQSLLKTEVPENLSLVIVDDKSTDRQTQEIIESFEWPGVSKFTIWHQNNFGIRGALKSGIEEAILNMGAEIVINLDSDALVRRDFFKRLLELKTIYPECIISGFNTTTQNRNPVIDEFKDHFHKKYCSGINMCFNKKQYERWILPALQQPGNWDYNTSLACVAEVVPVVVTKPSVVQHNGVKYSTLSHTDQPDIAEDFVLLELPNVTLFGIAYNDPEGMKRAAKISTQNIKFGAEHILTEKLFEGREGYSKFCITELIKYVETDFVLKIEPDGYVQNPLAWSDDFLNYDYIGATWGYKDNMNVGNGGFSLRSRRLQQLLYDHAGHTITNYHPEDHVICRVHRKFLEKQGIRFAPEEVANRFSIEAFGVPSQFQGGQDYGDQFGFHGYNVKNLPFPPIQKQQHRHGKSVKPVPARHRFR